MAKNLTSEWRHLQLPSKDELSYILEQYIATGILQPEDVPIITQDPSLLSSFVDNPELVASQIGALRQMETLGQGRMTDVDRANMISGMQAEAQQERAAREAIMQNAQMRGVGGSGLEFAAQLQSQQNAANRANKANIDANVAAQQRGLQALQQAGQMATQFREQDFSQEARKSAAQDAINQWNAANRQNIMGQNVQTRNDAAAKNLAERQRIADANVNQRNAQQKLFADAAQQDFENRVVRTQGLTGAITSAADYEAKRKAAQDAQNAALIGAAGTIIGGMVGGPAGAAAGGAVGSQVGQKTSDERAKQDVSQWDPSSFLDSIVPVKFKYKPEMEQYGENPTEKHAGVMAQDVEKTAPQAVEEYDGIKQLKLDELVPMLLAASGAMHKRLKDLENK